MTSIYLKKIKTKVFFAVVSFCLFVLLIPSDANAQSKGLSLSVTPTLFQMSAEPSQTWNSGVKVVNNNAYPITVYAQVVNFAPQGETGEGKFLPVFEKSTEGTTLAEWITISQDPIIVPPEKSYTFPFSVHVPENASPGGHFAAILIGTKPPKIEGTVQVSTSQVVTSLMFVRIAGDVVEDGSVREFRVTHSLVDTPKADFEVRFENKGNVYLQPQGEIDITNMWGKERGVIPINQQTHFGNVLPKSIRKFEFSWNGEPSFSDIGRYKAILTLAYGEESKKFVTSIVYFYVIPVKVALVVFGSLIALLLFVTWGIKAYVRRMLVLAGVEPDYKLKQRSEQRLFIRDGDVRIGKRISVQAPVKKGVLDLQEQLKKTHAFFDTFEVLIKFVILYRLFFGSLIVVTIAIIAVAAFFHQATKEQRDYNVVISNPDTNIKLSSEDVIYNKSQNEHAATSSQIIVNEDQPYSLVLVNSSDKPGIAASLQLKLEQKGYSVADLQSDFGQPKERSVIIYDIGLEETALDLSKEIGNALLSARPEEATSTKLITVYIGNDYIKE